jgi:hypothetical protein
LLDPLTLHYSGQENAADAMRHVVQVFVKGDVTEEEELRWLWLAFLVVILAWDDGAGRILTERHVRVARESGVVAVLTLALASRTSMDHFAGEVAEAQSLSEEIGTIVTATGLQITNHVALLVAVWRGRRDEFEQLERATESQNMSRREGVGLTVGDWARAMLGNSLGRYDEGREFAARASADPQAPGIPANWTPAELVEAAVRTGDRDLANRAFVQLTATTRAGGTDWAGA